MSSTSPFAAVVFDLDGTLTDTEHVWEQVRRRLAAEDGVDYPEDATPAMMGMSTAEWSAYMAETVGLKGTAENAARRVIQGMVDHYGEGVTILPGARKAVARMAALGPVGIASSSPLVLIEKAIEVLGITDLVSAHVSTEQVERGKPAPDGYLRCAELLGADPTECVAVEDSTNGAVSALDAGMATIVVPPAFHPPSADVLARCTVIDSLDGLTVELLERMAG
ncbi:HAD family phosphatase [Luteococcus sediminum]|uniref:HAD family hydrolase n=1 Tax=Luteococcus sp. TaxID=1969402 RepID=UPI003736510E